MSETAEAEALTARHAGAQAHNSGWRRHESPYPRTGEDTTLNEAWQAGWDSAAGGQTIEDPNAPPRTFRIRRVMQAAQELQVVAPTFAEALKKVADGEGTEITNSEDLVDNMMPRRGLDPYEGLISIERRVAQGSGEPATHNDSEYRLSNVCDMGSDRTVIRVKLNRDLNLNSRAGMKKILKHLMDYRDMAQGVRVDRAREHGFIRIEMPTRDWDNIKPHVDNDGVSYDVLRPGQLCDDETGT